MTRATWRDAVEATHRNELARWASEHAPSRGDGGPADPLAAFARRAVATCEQIGRRNHLEHHHLATALSAAGVVVEAPRSVRPAQRHELVVRVEADEVDTAVATLDDLGYERHHTWSPGGERSLRRTGHEVVVARDADSTSTVRLRWRPPRSRGPVERTFSPTPADWALVELPRWAWRAYHVVRPVRLALERTGLRSDDHADLEPFLVTPASLVGPLLDLAAVGTDDVVVDLGCGDGRIVAEAAATRGCRAIGIERAPELVARARREVDARGLDDRVRIVEGDGLAHDLSDATVVVLFLPTVVARRVVPALLRRLRPGARVVLHEQSRLPADLPVPDRSEPIVTDDAVTVAHRWDIRRPATGRS